MAQAARKIEPETPAITPEHLALIAEVAAEPSIVLLDQAKLDAYVAALRAQATLEPSDISTAKGRDIIKAAAAEIARKKSAIDKERLRLTEQWRVQTSCVNTVGKLVVAALDELRDDVRAPLTIWEKADEARKLEAQSIIDDMMAASVITADDTVADLNERLDRIRGRNLSDELFGPRIEMVTDLRDSTVKTLAAGIEKAEQAARDAAELQRLRDEAAARAEADRQREAREAAEREAEEARKREAVEAEQRRQDEAARIEREREEAAEEARRLEAQARQEAQDEKDRVERIKREEAERKAQAEIDAANARAVEAERLAQEERDSAARKEAQRLANERAEREAWAKREADLAHRATVKANAEAAIVAIGVSAKMAEKIVQAITAGDVPAVSIAF